MDVSTTSLPHPVARASMLAPWVEQVRAMGAPAEALLERAAIPPELLRHPDAAVPLAKALRWIELACRSLDNEHLGLHVGIATPIEHLGPYGRLLAGSLTLHQYVRRGITLYDRVVEGQRFWMSTHGTQARIHIGAPWEPRLGDYQSHLNSFAITIASIRRFAGASWAPTEISLGYRAREPIPAVDLFGGARLVHRPGESYIEFPRALLALPLRPGARPHAAGHAVPPSPLPHDLAGLVELQIGALLFDRAAPIDLVAEALGMSRRSLQRGLASQGVSYSDLLSSVRLSRAADWLQHTDRPVLQIALDLGYTDPSNFTRAFRRQTGVAPRTFRLGARRERRRPGEVGPPGRARQRSPDGAR